LSGHTPIFCAVQYSNTAAIEMLLRKGAKGTDAAFKYAIKEKNYPLASQILDSDTDLAKDSSGESLLNLAVKSGHHPLVDMLWANGAKWSNETVIHSLKSLACGCGCRPSLLPCRNLHLVGLTQLCVQLIYAIQFNHSLVPRILDSFDWQAEGSNGCTFLWRAAIAGSMPLVQALLARGAQWDTRAVSDYTFSLNSLLIATRYCPPYKDMDDSQIICLCVCFYY